MFWSRIFVLFEPYVRLNLMYVYIFLFYVRVTEWPLVGKIAAHSAYGVFSEYKYLIVNLVFPASVFGV